MLYDFQTQKWSELARGNDSASTVWSHDSKFVYVQLNDHPAELVRVSVPDGKIEPVLDLRDMTLGGYYSGWVSLLPDDSPLLMLERREKYTRNLQARSPVSVICESPFWISRRITQDMPGKFAKSET